MSSNAEQPPYEKEAYLAQLEAARDRVRTTKLQLLEWVKKLDEHAAAEFIHIEPMTALFPTAHAGQTYRLVYDIHTGEKRYGCLGVAIRSESMRSDLCKASQSDLTKTLQAHTGAKEAKRHAAAIQRLNRFNERVAGLRFLGADFEQPINKGAVLPRWFEALSLYGMKCAPLLEAAFHDFAELTSALDEAMFEFNSTMGKVRYRAIRCSYTVDDFDLLGPSNPALKVVVKINRTTKQRRYYMMRDFKKGLKKKRIGQQLKRELGREPEPIEVANALKALRPRKESEWITKEVIKACYFGRSIKDILKAQENLVAVMQPWTSLRSQLQALLP